jgi:hypothetical protein
MVEVASDSSETAVCVWYSTGLFAVPGFASWVLIRDAQKEFRTQALLLCTDLEADPHKKIVCWFVMRWQLEVTFQEMRRHLGFETQRQCSELAIREGPPRRCWGYSRSSPCVRSAAHEAKHAGRPASGVVAQTPPDFRRRSGACTQRFVGQCDFLRVGCAQRDGKSPTGIGGTTN